MAIYTRKLDELMTAYSKHLEKQTRDALNPKASAVGSLLRMAFRTVATGDVLLTKIYDAMGWDTESKDPYARVKEMAEIAEKNGNTGAATRLKKATTAIDAAEEAVAKAGTATENSGPLKALRAMKKLNTPFVP